MAVAVCIHSPAAAQLDTAQDLIARRRDARKLYAYDPGGKRRKVRRHFSAHGRQIRFGVIQQCRVRQPRFVRAGPFIETAAVFLRDAPVERRQCAFSASAATMDVSSNTARCVYFTANRETPLSIETQNAMNPASSPPIYVASVICPYSGFKPAFGAPAFCMAVSFSVERLSSFAITQHDFLAHQYTTTSVPTVILL